SIWFVLGEVYMYQYNYKRDYLKDPINNPIINVIFNTLANEDIPLRKKHFTKIAEIVFKIKNHNSDSITKTLDLYKKANLHPDFSKYYWRYLDTLGAIHKIMGYNNYLIYPDEMFELLGICRVGKLNKKHNEWAINKLNNFIIRNDFVIKIAKHITNIEI